MLTRECKDVNLRILNLIVCMYLQPFEGVYNICTYNIDTLTSKSLELWFVSNFHVVIVVS